VRKHGQVVRHVRVRILVAVSEVVQTHDGLEAGARMGDSRVQVGLLRGGGLLVRVGDRELTEIDQEVVVAKTVSDEILGFVSKK
jgi:hypothetical protein